MASPDYQSQLDSTAQGPAQAQTAAGSAQAQRLPDLIQADRYTLAKSARAKASRGLMFSKLLPAAAAPDQQGSLVGRAGNGGFDSPGV